MLDATVLFAGTGWPRWSYEVLRHALRGDFQLVLSPLVIEQARRNLFEKLPDYVGAFEAWLGVIPYEEVRDPSPKEVHDHQILVRDPSDVPVAISAIHANVYCLVSEDKDLTSDDASTKELRGLLTVMRPVIFLRKIMGWSSEDLERIRHRNWPVEQA
jgi:predicted nucleic acid-binding protein